MQSMINKGYENLAQRSIYYFIATYPPFYPYKSADVSEEEQKAVYEFLKGIYVKLYDNPTLLGLRLAQDDSFGDWQQQKTKPELAPAIRSNIKKIEEFIAAIWVMSKCGKAKGNSLVVSKGDSDLKSSIIKSLAAFEIKVSKNVNGFVLDFPFKVNGLKLLAEISALNVKPPKDGKQKPFLLFSRGVFDITAPWSREIFGNMFEDQKPFNTLIDFLDQNEYNRIDNKEYNNQISLDYIKSYGKPEDELKWAWAERTHSGIEVIYEETKKNQPLLSLRIPYFGELLKNSSAMSQKVKEFVISRTKKCNGCRYCVQTDKTGNRPFACVSIDENMLCPLFAGFQYRWKTIDEKTVEGMIELLKFIDNTYAGRRC